MQIVDPLANPAQVELGTLDVGDVFTCESPEGHFVVTSDPYGVTGHKAVLCLETCIMSNPANDLMVVPRSAPTVTFD